MRVYTQEQKDLYKTKMGKLYTYNGELQLVIDYYEAMIDGIATPCYVVYTFKKNMVYRLEECYLYHGPDHEDGGQVLWL